MAATGKCAYCGKNYTPHPSHSSKRKHSTCPPCEEKLAWVLRSVRYSDKLSRHVSIVEARECQARNERAATIEPPQTTPDLFAVATPPATPAIESRIDKVERIMLLFAREFGIPVD